MTKKSIVRFLTGSITMLLFLVVCMGIFAPTEVKAATKKIAKSDFVITENGKKIDFYSDTENMISDYQKNYEEYGMSKKSMDSWLKNKLYSYYIFCEPSEEQKELGWETYKDSFPRGITYGASASKVKKQYGTAKKVAFKLTDKVHNMLAVQDDYWNIENISYYYEYKMEKKNYKIRFYFTDKDKLQSVLYLYNAQNMKPYWTFKEGGKLPVITTGKQKATKKDFAGRTYYEISKGAKLRDILEVKQFKDCDESVNVYMNFIDNKGEVLYIRSIADPAGYYFDNKTTLEELILGTEFLDPNTDDFVDSDEIRNLLSNPDSYLYIELQLREFPEECTKHNYIYRVKPI